MLMEGRRLDGIAFRWRGACLLLLVFDRTAAFLSVGDGDLERKMHYRCDFLCFRDCFVYFRREVLLRLQECAVRHLDAGVLSRCRTSMVVSRALGVKGG